MLLCIQIRWTDGDCGPKVCATKGSYLRPPENNFARPPKLWNATSKAAESDSKGADSLSNGTSGCATAAEIQRVEDAEIIGK